MSSTTIVMFKRDHKTVNFQVFDAAGNAIDTTNWGDIVFTVKDVGDEEGTAKFSRSTATPGEIDAVDVLVGKYSIKIIPSNTATLTAGTFVYDLQGIDENTKTLTIAKGDYVLKQDVTI